MEVGEFVAILARLVVGALGTFLAILLWSKTRDAAWVLVVVGTLVSYVGIVYFALQLFGIIVGELVEVSGIPVVRIGLENLPMLLYVAGFVVMIIRARGGARGGARSGAKKAEPEATEPEATEPEATEPEATEPEATEPAEPTAESVET